MSKKPNPVALTAAMIEHRRFVAGDPSPVAFDYLTFDCLSASLASDLHHLAPACARIALGCCNESFWCDAQSIVEGEDLSEGRAPDARTPWAVSYIQRIDRKLAKLNKRLEPLGLEARAGGDPRGWTLRLVSVDKSRPVPRNGFDLDAWGIG